MRKNKVDVLTLGCAKNLVDSERLMALFAREGYTVAPDPDRLSGELVVINTCGFIESAREESIEVILQAIAAKQSGQVGQVIVMGCLSERYRKELQEELPEVDRFYGKFDWMKLLSDLGKAYHASPLSDRLITTPKHYAYLKISEGCDRHCAYCSIPLMTGRYVSRSIEDLLLEAQDLASRGVKELLLIAQDLTYYGRDLYRSAKLPELVDRLCEVDGIEWIRLHYGYPAHFPMDLLRVMHDRSKVCNYLDIALQHSSTHMLQMMRRNVTEQETRELIACLRREIPDIHIRTTMMVGHPGESEEDFEHLLRFVQEMRFERLGAFAYSEEEGTYGAQHYRDAIPAETKQDRLNLLMQVQQEIAFAVAEKKVGQSLPVLVDRIEHSGATSYLVGRTQYDSPDVDPEVFISTESLDQDIVGNIIEVEVTGTEGFDLTARKITP